jgi:hypothetical protein
MLPIFVRSRPSRTRAERPNPSDRVPDAFDCALMGARGAALALVAAYLSRGDCGGRRVRLLGILTVTVAEANPTESDKPGAWPGIILDSADGRGLARYRPSGGAAGSRG